VDLTITELAFRIGLSIALGALVGVEREYKRKIEKEVLIFGLRTAVLVALLGFLFAYLSNYVDLVSSFVIGLAIVTVISTTAFVLRFLKYGYLGLTTYVSIFIIYILGFLVGIGIYTISVSIAIITTAFLTFKSELHKMVKHLSKEEIHAAIKFAIVAFVILPFLPNDYVDPYHIFNPFRFWLIVVAISLVSFIFFIVLRKLKEGGLFVSGLLGGFINSEVTTYEISKSVRAGKLIDQAVAGVLFSYFSLFLSQWIILILVTQSPVPLVYLIAPTITLGILVEILAYPGLLEITKTSIEIKSPFSLKPALIFSFLFFLTSASVGLIKPYLQTAFIYLVVFLISLLGASPVVTGIAFLYTTNHLSAILSAKLMLVALIGGLANKLVWCRVSKNEEFVKKVTTYTLMSILVPILFLLAYTLIYPP